MSTALVKRASERAGEARVLDARENRGKVRQELARNMSGRSLVELCLDVPRGSASNDDSERLFLAGLQRLEQELGVSPAEMGEDAAGYYGLFVTELPALLIRRRASRIEEQPSWDRQMSIECYGLGGNLGATGRVPRSAVGAPAAR
ncbi:citrate lyase holo-[acyl-carrier protein] synthase [Archangium lipolyticum]|uniref:citrate lyase holo-[acyl-carrier protein] synthase n=1 Tax=Archangium lipolyticum TaxID=2970465 RepID=UPI002149AAD2|nr:citrate lyase holo-[acyl-carrier protein] synthase [Archangium lipolyticum]